MNKGGHGIIKIDKKTVESLLSMSDEKLAQVLRIIASSSGTPLREGQPDSKTVKGIRALLTEVEDGDITRAMSLLEAYKNGKKYGG